MNRDSNAYTFLFATLMVVTVASVLAFLATYLKPLQMENMRNEKMQNILSTVGVTDVKREDAQKYFDQYIVEQITLNADGTQDDDILAFDVELRAEMKKPIEKQKFPLFIAERDNKRFYIIPLRGVGLWDAIWGYMALQDDFNTIAGVSFDHKAETPGLGAEITTSWFIESFKDEKIFDANGNLVGVIVAKGNNNKTNKDDNRVDAISGATITGDGVTDMIVERLTHYRPFIEKQRGNLAVK